MKKIYNIIFIFVLFMIFNINVKAKDYECIYEVNEGSSFLSFEGERYGGFIIENGKIRYISDAKKPLQKVPEILDVILNEKETEKTIIQKLNGNCPDNVYICASTGDTIGSEGFVVLKSELIDNISQSKQNVLDGLGLNRDKCYVGTYNADKSTAPSVHLEWSCDKYDKFIGILKTYDCKNNSNCNSKMAKDYNETKDKLRSFCKLQLENGNSFDECVESCINIAEDISEIEGTDYKDNKCSFSKNLLGFINNILKWVKYLIPAIIIILSILDFIKAIGADKDEEMKKAQQKFMKRLVIAVLIFIIPFILEFVLDKMGFVAEGCGIIEF